MNPPPVQGPVLAVSDLVTEFRVRRRLGFGSDVLRAVNGVSLSIARGQTMGLVGESGCGKSTLGRTIVGLYRPASGTVALNGRPFSGIGRGEMRSLRRQIQIVFQDPFASLDPRMSVHEIVAEPLRINGLYREDAVRAMIERVGLSPEAGARRPAEFSGGQRQRIAIARALALDPDVVILDEAVSALDVSIQAQIINLLRQLQRELGLAYLFISHDLSVVRHISQNVAVMYLGRIVEQGTRDEVFDAPAHPYTQALLSSSSHPAAGGGKRQRIVLQGEIPNPMRPPSGCVFRTRCFKAAPRCAAEVPALIERTGPGHLSACHFATSEPAPPSHRTPLPATATP